MARPQHRQVSDDGALVGWVSGTLGLAPGDSARIPPTAGGSVRALRRPSGGPYGVVEVDVPGWVARDLGMSEAYPVDVDLRHDGTVHSVPLVHTIEDMIGVVPYVGSPVSIEDMDEAIKTSAAERFRRSWSD